MPDRTATPTVASVLLLDEPQLARRARTTLAAADTATVVGPVPMTVTVRDRDGEPELADLPVALAGQVGRGRRTTLVIAPRPAEAVRLVLDGRLVEREGVVVLAVEAVWVGCPHGHGHARPLDLTAYATAAPDRLLAGIPRLVAHLNAGHGGALRALAARRLVLDPGEVAAAALVDLDPAGVTLRVVHLDGVTDLPLPFGRRAVATGELHARLRAVLTGS